MIRSNEDLIVEYISTVTGKPIPEISEGDQIYYDLGISGDDFDDMLKFLNLKFGTNFDGMVAGKYTTPEAAFSFRAMWNAVLGRDPYLPLSVGDLFSAVNRGFW